MASGDSVPLKLSAVQPYVLALDVGTTNVRGHIYDQQAQIIGYAERKIEVLCPQPDLAEMDEEVLWQQVQEVINKSIKAAGLKATDVTCMGITSQRGTFITWDRDTGQTFHRFITWKDRRSSDYVKAWNKSYTMWFLNYGSALIHLFTRQPRYLAASILRFLAVQVTMRLKWQLDHDDQIKKRMAEKKVMFGTIDTWLLWKLTKGQVHATDYSAASSTGLYDPFSMEWSTIISGLLDIPLHIFPPIRDTSGKFGECHEDLFGAAIPITSAVADQQSAMFGQCCFEVGDVKCTMGTGTFIDCNTGDKPHASVAGLYPLIGWKIGSELVFVAEGFSSDTGCCLEWAKSLDLFEKVEDTSSIACSVPDCGGVYFIPSFSGLQAPINDDKACTSLIGISPTTSQAHIVRAILEALAFRFKLLYDTVLKETTTPLTNVVKCDGGVSNNEFLVQLTSNLIKRTIDRPQHKDMTSLGAAFLAGLAMGVWKNKEELKAIRKTERQFHCQAGEEYDSVLLRWKDAMKRSMKWYKDVNL